MNDHVEEKNGNLPTPSSIMDVVGIMVQKGADLSQIEHMMGLQERWEANEARKAYVTAMAQFKKNPPEIIKDAEVSYPTSSGGPTRYRHASLANVTETIGSALAKQGLMASWKTEQRDGGVAVTCTITHKQGHSESTTLHASPDNSGNKNPIQAIGSTVSYLERYTILALTGLATKEMDDDGGNPLETITAEQAKYISTRLTELGGTEQRFMTNFGVDTIAEMPASKYETAMNLLARISYNQTTTKGAGK